MTKALQNALFTTGICLLVFAILNLFHDFGFLNEFILDHTWRDLDFHRVFLDLTAAVSLAILSLYAAKKLKTRTEKQAC